MCQLYLPYFLVFTGLNLLIKFVTFLCILFAQLIHPARCHNIKNIARLNIYLIYNLVYGYSGHQIISVQLESSSRAKVNKIFQIHQIKCKHLCLSCFIALLLLFQRHVSFASRSQWAESAGIVKRKKKQRPKYHKQNLFIDGVSCLWTQDQRELVTE